MPNNIAVSITADVADLQVKRAIMSAELKAATKDLNDFAKTANTSGITDTLRTSMLGAADAVARTRNQIRGVDSELKSLATTEALTTEATVAETVATEANTSAHVSSRAATEALVLVHEALQGRYTRMTGSAMILTQAMAGQEATAGALTALMSPLGLAIGGTVAVMGAAVVAGMKYNAEQQALVATSLGVGAAAGLNATQLRAAGEAASEWSDRSVRASTEAAQAFAAAGVKSQQIVTELSGDVELYANLTGVKTADAQKALADAMRDPVKGAEDLNAQLGILDSTAMDHIRTLVAMGDKDQAVAVLTQALQQRMDEAKESGVGLSGEFSELTSRLSDMWGWLGRVNERLLEFQQFGLAGSDVVSQMQGKADSQANMAHMLTELNQASAGGAAAFGATPEGKDQAEQDQLLSNLNRVRQALIADTALHGENSEAVQHDKDTIADYTRAISTYLPEAEKAHKLAGLEDQLAQARHGHNKALIDDLSRQIELTKLSGQVMSAEEANQKAADARQVSASRASPGRQAHGPSIVSEWQDQLHQAEVLSNDFFGDQTQRELEFWQSKVGLTRDGSKEWLEVQSKIYEAQKSLARQGYEEHLADLNDQIEADKNSWQLTKADWEVKLAYIKEKFGEESTEYLNAHRDYARLEREHQDQMLQAQTQGENKQVEELKTHLAAMRAIRQSDAQSQEAVINDKAEGSPLGEIEAARQIAQVRAQLAQQEQDDLEVTYQRQTELLAEQVARAKDYYTEDSKQYLAAVANKEKADRDYKDAKARLDAQVQAQTIQSILQIKQAYQSYISGMTSSFSSGIVGMIGRTQTFSQALSGLYNSLLSTVSNILTRMLTRWIVVHVLMSSEQRAQLAIESAQHVAAEAAKTAATTTGAAARTTAETTALATGAVAQRLAAVAQVPVFAALAGAGGIASMAAAPFPLDLTAPAFGASMAAAATAAGSLASLAVGTNFVPNDMVAQIHAGERIIPAADNKLLMAAINDNQAIMATANSNSDAAPNAGGFGDLHVHLHGIADGAGAKRFFMDNKNHLYDAIHKAVRDGKR